MYSMVHQQIGYKYPSVSWTHSATINSDATNYTFNSCVVNCAVGDLVVVIDNNSSIGSAQGTTATIGGNAMGAPIVRNASISDGVAIYQWTATAALGTVTIVLNHSAGSTRCSVNVLVLKGLASHTNTGTGQTNGSATNLTVPIGVQSGGILVGSYQQRNGAGAACTWTGAAMLTKLVDINQEGTATMSLAVGQRMPKYGSTNVNCAIATTANNCGMAMASWR